MSLRALEEGLVTGAIAGISSLIAIVAVDPTLPSGMDLMTAGLAAALAGLVRYATLREIPPKE